MARSRSITPMGQRRTVASWLRIGIVPILALACIAGLVYENHAFEREQKTTWTSVPATVIGSRLRPIARFSLQYGSKPLYELDVLASYTADGVPRQDWLPTSEPPQTESEARSEAATLAGKRWSVRWNPGAADHKIATIQ